MPLCEWLRLEFADGELFSIVLLGVQGVSGGVQDLEGVVVAMAVLRLKVSHENTLVLGYHILLLLQQIRSILKSSR